MSFPIFHFFSIIFHFLLSFFQMARRMLQGSRLYRLLIFIWSQLGHFGVYCGEKMCLISIKTPKLNSSPPSFFFLVSNFTFCFQSARLEPYKIEQEWNHMVLLPRPTLCTRTYTSRLLCMFFSSVNAFWTNLEIPALLSRETVTEFLSIKNLYFKFLMHLKELLLGSTL